MDVELLRDPSVDLFEEVQELGRPVAPVALADDEARGDIEGGEQRGRAVPHIVVRPAFGDARHHRQHRLFTVEGLDLALFVDAENQRPVGRREVETDDIAHLVPVRRTLAALGILPGTFYRWYDRFRSGGREALEDRSSRPRQVWNRIPDDVREQVLQVALDEPELSPRELAARFTDTRKYF